MAFDTKSREFQYKIINSGYLGTNVHLKRIGKLNSSACSFREWDGWIPRNLLVTCRFTQLLWERLVCWCISRDIRVQSLTFVDVIFGDWKTKKDFLLLNHILIIAKQYIYSCRNNNSKLAFNVLLARIKLVIQLKIAKEKNKLRTHLVK